MPGLDRNAFDKLVIDHLPGARLFALRLTGQADAADEITQEALLRVAAHWRQFRGQSSFKTWLFRILVNVFRDRQARRPSPGPLPEHLPETVPRGPVAQVIADETARLVAAAVSALPPRQREVLVLSVYENLSAGEIAEALEISEQNVRTTLHLARERLRQRLSAHLAIKSHE